MSTAFFVRHRRWVLTAILGVAGTWAIGAGAQAPQTTLPLDPQRERGASITPARSKQGIDRSAIRWWWTSAGGITHSTRT